MTDPRCRVVRKMIAPEDVRPFDLIRATSVVRAPAGYPDEEDAVGEASLELLHRPAPKPAVGAVLTGKQVKSRMWKRGTKFCYITPGQTFLRGRTYPLYTILELGEDGVWRRYPHDGTFLVDMRDTSELVLLYRPEEEADRRGAK